MQERNEAERRARWPCLNIATWRRERSDRALQQIRQSPQSITKMKKIADMEFFRRIE